MNMLNSLSCIFIALCLLKFGNCLECYSCNVTVSSNQDNPCKNVETLTKCTDPAVCLSATYSLEDPKSRVKYYSTIKSCYFAGPTACDRFLKNIRTVNSPDAKLEISENCLTCSEPGCNKSKPSAASTPVFVPSVLAVALFCCIFNKL
ncbi:hypothetical protein NQ318_022444 [Aromia moschata]|uniref:Protein quiver n=1 Tax=Aromia moschata TaxID=1265417 RepID=A0AAV8Z6S7_9CUCU|nr:hypothetical protein NQ318_022444 [Aromia moschata]